MPCRKKLWSVQFTQAAHMLRAAYLAIHGNCYINLSTSMLVNYFDCRTLMAILMCHVNAPHCGTRRRTRTRTVIAMASMINNHDKVILIIIEIEINRNDTGNFDDKASNC